MQGLGAMQGRRPQDLARGGGWFRAGLACPSGLLAGEVQVRSPAGGGAAEDVVWPGSSCWFLATSGVGTRQEVAQGVAERGGEGLGGGDVLKLLLVALVVAGDGH